MSFYLSRKQLQLLAGNLTRLFKNILLRGFRTVVAGCCCNDFQTSWLIEAAESGQGGDGLCSPYSGDKSTELQNLRTSGCHLKLSTVGGCDVAADRRIRKVRVGSCVSVDVVFWRYARSMFDRMLHLSCLPSVKFSSLSTPIVSTPPWTWLDLSSQYATLSLIIVGYWFLWERERELWPQCRRVEMASDALHEGPIVVSSVRLVIFTMEVTAGVRLVIVLLVL